MVWISAATAAALKTGMRGPFDSESAEILNEGMLPGSAAVALAIEHSWAVTLVHAIAGSGVEEAQNSGVPAPPSAQRYYAPPHHRNYQALPAQYYAPPPAAEEDRITQLERLGTLKAQELLTEEEFAAAKQRLLAG